MTNAVHKFWHHADQTPDQVALREGDRSWTYGVLRDQIQSYAQRLTAAGIKPGERVLLVAPTAQEFVVAYHAILAIGAVAVTINAMSTTAELEYFIDDSECSLVIAWHESTSAARTAAEGAQIDFWVLEAGDVQTDESSGAGLPVEVAIDDNAILLYTSGTTGQPKGAQLTHGNVMACATAAHDVLGSNSSDRVGTGLPLFHVFGQVCVMASTFWVGASLSLLRPFSGPAALKMAAEHQLSILSGVPTMWNAMLHADVDVTRDDLSNLRLASSGGAALPLVVAQAFDDRFGCMVLDGYGLSETTGTATFNAPSGVRKEGSVGFALAGHEVSIVGADGAPVAHGERGEVAIKGPSIMKGYWRRPEATAEVMRDGWFLSGDIGIQDEDGYLWIVDRKKDLVIRGGYNVYPREIEEVLYMHPAIREVAVIGIPDDRLGEEIGAVVALHPGASLEPADLRSWAHERLSAYKVPRIYQVVVELPKGATGKILKRQIDRSVVEASGTRVRQN